MLFFALTRIGTAKLFGCAFFLLVVTAPNAAWGQGPLDLCRLAAVVLGLDVTLCQPPPQPNACLPVRPVNFGAEWFKSPVPSDGWLVNRCDQRDDDGSVVCAEFPAGAVVRSFTAQLTNFTPGHVTLWVLLTSTNGTPWHSSRQTLYSGVVLGSATTAPPITVPGPWALPPGSKVWWAIAVFNPDGQNPRVEHQTTLSVELSP